MATHSRKMWASAIPRSVVVPVRCVVRRALPLYLLLGHGETQQDRRKGSANWARQCHNVVHALARNR